MTSLPPTVLSPPSFPAAADVWDWAFAALAVGDPGAEAGFRRAVALDPAGAEGLYIHGRALRDGGDAGGGGVWRRRAFLIRPAALASANHVLGLAFERAGRTADAAVCQSQALAQTDAGSLVGQAALTALARLIRATDGADPPGQGGWAGVWEMAGHAAHAGGAHDAAAAAFARVVVERPDDPLPCRYVGDARAAAGGAVADVQPAFCRGLTLNPAEESLWASLGHSFYRGGDYGRAATLFARVCRLAPEPAVGWRSLGSARFRRGWLERADSAFRRAAALAPDDAAIWLDLGHTAYSLGLAARGRGRFAVARTAFVRAARLEPGEAGPGSERQGWIALAAFRHLAERVETELS